MYYYPIIAVVLFAIGLSCKGNSHKVMELDPNPEKIMIQKPGSHFSDTVFFNNSVAVFYKPDSLQLLQMRNLMDTMTFESSRHDCYYQSKNAHDILAKYWPEIAVCDISQARYLCFVKNNDKERVVIDLDDYGDACGLILFDGKQKPTLVDMTNAETALRFYFIESGTK